MARQEISLGLEYVGGIPQPTTDDVGKLVEVALDEYGDPTYHYTAATDAIAADGTLAAALAPLLVAGDLAPSLEGRLLRAPQILTSGTAAVINHPDGTRLIRIRGVGGGGGGGGTDGVAGSMGSCGGSASYGEKVFTATASSSTYTVGAAGSVAVGAAGGNGGASTFTHGSTTVTLPGGNGGGLEAGGTSVAFELGAAGGGAATNADFEIQGQRGGCALRPVSANNPVLHTGPGGSTPLGLGGGGSATTSAIGGRDATGYGSGGSGRLSGSSAGAGAGGSAGGGVWIVEEYS